MSCDKLVLVCVTPQQSSETLVKSGENIAKEENAALEVVSVLPIAAVENSVNHNILERLYQTAKNSGGEMAVYFSDDPILTVSAHIAKRKPITIVTGFPGENSNDFINLIRSLFPETPISMVDKDGRVYRMMPSEAISTKL